MNSYKIIKYNHLPFFRFEKNGEAIADIDLHRFIGYGFTIKTTKNEIYKLDSKGIFWWRKIELTKNGLPFGDATLETLILGNEKFSIERREIIKINEEIICTVKFKNKQDTEYRTICFWDFEDERYEFIILILVLLEFQSGAAWGNAV